MNIFTWVGPVSHNLEKKIHSLQKWKLPTENRQYHFQFRKTDNKALVLNTCIHRFGAWNKLFADITYISLFKFPNLILLVKWSISTQGFIMTPLFYDLQIKMLLSPLVDALIRIFLAACNTDYLLDCYGHPFTFI